MWDVRSSFFFVNGALKRKENESMKVATVEAFSLQFKNSRHEKLFSTTHETNTSSWSYLITVFARRDQSVETLRAYSSMRNLSLKPDRFSFPCVLKSCSALCDIVSGRLAHQQVFIFGFQSDTFVTSALVKMYSRCGQLEDARRMFDEMPHRNLVSWTSMIAAYAQSEKPFDAILLFKHLLIDESQESDILDPVAFVSVLNACSQTCQKSITEGVHGFLLKYGFHDHVTVSNTLNVSYAKCGEMAMSRKVFDGMPEKDRVSWNTMIASYAQNGWSNEAIDIFYAMLKDKTVQHNGMTLPAVLLACSNSGALQLGRCIHNQVVRMGLDRDTHLLTSIIDMYCRCGRLEKARNVFEGAKHKNVWSWSAMVAGYGMHGYAKKALVCFSDMITAHVKPGFVTMVSVLAACSHAGLLAEGWHWFRAMRREFGIEPGLAHYGCMVDLLGRAGFLQDAYDLVSEMKVEPDFVMWGSLLGWCRIHKNVELGEICATKLLELDPKHGGCLMLLSNMYADARRWEDAERIRVLMRGYGLVRASPKGVSKLGV